MFCGDGEDRKNQGEAAKDKPDKPCDDPNQSCPLATLIVHVHKETEGGDPIENAQVTISGPQSGAKLTDAKGKAVFEKITPGDYHVKARKDEHTPDPAEKTGVSVPPDSTTEETLVLSLVEYHMHLDADRDGTVDDDRTDLDKWEWGKTKKGAIILCNDDDDEGASKSDNEDSEINAGNDKDEIAPLEIRRTGPKPPPDWEGFLEVSPADKDRIRIFDSRATGAKEILGKAAGNRYKFPDLDFTKKEFGMEAVVYAGDGFDGEIMITFTVEKGGGSSTSEQGKVRVAPWIMPNHLDKAEKVYVVEFPTDSYGIDNAGFITDFEPLVTAAGCTLHPPHAGGDRWMQDCMEWGYHSLPTVGIRSVMRAARNRPLKSFPKTLRETDLGYHEPAPLGGSTLDATGNLEASPPCKKGKKDYPFGRIYFGGTARGSEKFSDKVREFLEKQVVQDPIPLDTTWLLVAHVDEVISFVPAPEAPGFKMLLASPKRAYEILDSTKASKPKAKMLTGRRWKTSSAAPWIDVEVSVEDFLDHGLTTLKSNFTHDYLRKYNEDRQDDMDTKIRDVLVPELGLDPAKDIIEVPVIFADVKYTDLADALTAGMVNMLVLNKHCIYPKAFGPVVGGKDVFEEDLKDNLKKLGLTAKSIDDWETYHIRHGEVHCGTNTLRTPKAAKWWEFEP